jgi:hypothetical protein
VTESTGTDWRQLREFAAVDLNKSFILSWYVESDILMIDIDVLLTEEHPIYEKPRPAEKVCIRPAIIEFPYCEEISVGDIIGESIGKTAESLGHGAIEGLQRLEDGRYEISGNFGTVLITSERPSLRLKGP